MTLLLKKIDNAMRFLRVTCHVDEASLFVVGKSGDDGGALLTPYRLRRVDLRNSGQQFSLL